MGAKQAVKTKRLKIWLVLTFSGLCLANMVLGIFPAESGPGKYIEGKLGGIRWTTGAMQRWGMFHTIPTLHRVRFRIVAKDSGGEGREYGVGLPGLRRVEAREEIRYHYTFLRIFDSDPEYLAPYVAAVAEELRASDRGLVEFSIEIEFEFTRHLYHIRKDGEMTMVVPKTMGPYRIDDA